ASSPVPARYVYPNVSELYRRTVEKLHEALNHDGTRTTAPSLASALAPTSDSSKQSDSGLRDSFFYYEIIGCGGSPPPLPNQSLDFKKSIKVRF
ncbi:MAG: hypothetical protein VW169_15570, partial [Rhodospirillaceae bacterium]